MKIINISEIVMEVNISIIIYFQNILQSIIFKRILIKIKINKLLYNFFIFITFWLINNQFKIKKLTIK